MNNFRENYQFKETDEWDVIKISQVNDKIITRLLYYLKSDISENFFISFESLLKLGNKVPETMIKNILNELNRTDEFKKEYGEKNVIDVNGARVNFKDGWGLVRASSNEPVLVLVFEAKNQEKLEEIENIFKKKLGKYKEVSKKWKNK